MSDENVSGTIVPVSDLVKTHNQMTELVREMKGIMDELIMDKDAISPITGNDITSWDGLMKEMEAVENEIKKEIKENGSDVTETQYFAIRKTTTFEYDPKKLREILPDEAGFYIETKESVKKAVLDKAIKDGAVPEVAKEALKEKSTSITFIDKAKIAAKEVKEIAV